jgi:hypothetical protein
MYLHITSTKPRLIDIIYEYTNMIYVVDDTIVQNINQYNLIQPLSCNLSLFSGMGRSTLYAKKPSCISKVKLNHTCSIATPVNECCSISQDEFKNGSYFLKCDECLNCFSIENITKWLEISPLCPLCRTQWTNKNSYKYII